ncbi:serine/threonine-protein kinase Nek8-like [Penaeus monodon]|uniref:serine/threonine-protein kinase Nek8-like n=1 Tax=Penaeus monodon TaxID=6687 RepID=UPI0018A7372C|nr:serine/threonine-protein kinase Nek8-like [Penaeus monodon]
MVLDQNVKIRDRKQGTTPGGNQCYLSPELCQEKPYNQKSDIWALGCVLYEMLTLKRAFEAETIPALIMKIMRGIFAPIHPRYSAEMRSLVHLLLHMDPAQRPNIHQVISQPLIFPTLFKLHADLGMVRCVSRPLRLSSVGTRTRSSRGSEDSTDREKNEGEKKGVNEETRSVDKEVVKQPAFYRLAPSTTVLRGHPPMGGCSATCTIPSLPRTGHQRTSQVRAGE